MGYLSQKKYKERENVFFVAASIIMVAVAFGLLLNPEFTFLNLNLFHFYCVGFIVFLAAVVAKKLVPILVLGLSLIVIYVLLAISGNIFFSDRVDGIYEAEIVFNNNLEIPSAMSKGVLVSDDKVLASYAVVNEEAPLMVIMVDFRGFDKAKYKALLKSLRKFVIKQDVEVVLLGDFGMPAWSRRFRKFTEASGLMVKNRFVFDGFFTPPQFYVLGYKEVGVKSITRKEKDWVVKISYNL